MQHNHLSRLQPDARSGDVPGPLLQRKCACGGVAGLDGQCAECRGTALQRSATGSARQGKTPGIVHDVLRSPGESLSPDIRSFMAARVKDAHEFVPPGNLAAATLTTNHPGDRYEQEADRIAQRITDAPDRPVPDSQTASSIHTFDRVRIHRDERAQQSARAVGARAYTVGHHIVFGSGAFAPESTAGRQLIAHELAHTLQQSRGSGIVMGTWDAAKSECSDAPTDKWIEKVVVEQEQPQKVTAFWSDGSTQSDECSTGKGHCCVDKANPSGVACTSAQSRTDGTNCTPITEHMGYPVKNRVLDHSGVMLWTEFVPDRAIALHEYTPVDGTPLSHGCVRMHHDMAKTIFCGVRQNRTWVQVHGFARPSCDHGKLQKEWTDDFAMGGRDPSKEDGETASEIREIRRELNAAFGRTLTVDEIQKLTVKDIPRCSGTAPLPKPASA